MSEPTLLAAIRSPTNTERIHVGAPGEIHVEVWNGMPADEQADVTFEDMGFVRADQAGVFLTEKQAASLLGQRKLCAAQLPEFERNLSPARLAGAESASRRLRGVLFTNTLAGQ